MDKALKGSFSKVKEELDIHLDSINGNTSEINANFDHIMRVEQKLDKLSERLDDMEMFFSNLVGTKPHFSRKQFEGVALSPREQEVFLTLYTTHEQLTFNDIARKTGLDFRMVPRYLESLISKRVPIIKKVVHNTIYFSLDEDFHQLQAKENVLNISQEFSQVLK